MIKFSQFDLAMFLNIAIDVHKIVQKLKTRVVQKNVNPEWNEDLTLSIDNPNLPVKIVSNFRLISAEVKDNHVGVIPE